MKRQVLSAAIAAAMGMTFTPMVQAALVIEGGVSDTASADTSGAKKNGGSDSSASEARHDWREGSRVVVKEFGEGRASTYRGFGNGMSLSDSLSLIVPEGWTVRLDDQVDSSKEVDWRARGDSWVEGLAGVMKDADYSARVYWDEQKVHVEPVPSQNPEVTAEMLAENREKGSQSEKQGGAVNEMTAEERREELRRRFTNKDKNIEASVESGGSKESGDSVAPISMTYMLPEGEYLSDALRTYVKKQGWKDLRWEIDEHYRIDAPIPMIGDDVIESVTNLVRTYQNQGGLMGVEPLFAKGNKMVVIKKMDRAVPTSDRR